MYFYLLTVLVCVMCVKCESVYDIELYNIECICGMGLIYKHYDSLIPKVNMNNHRREFTDCQVTCILTINQEHG